MNSTIRKLEEADLVVGRSLQPLVRDDGAMCTGFAIIIDVKKVKDIEGIDAKWEEILGEWQYTVMTDFGNTFNLTLEEMQSGYTYAPRGVDNLKERLMLQMELIGGVLGKL